MIRHQFDGAGPLVTPSPYALDDCGLDGSWGVRTCRATRWRSERIVARQKCAFKSNLQSRSSVIRHDLRPTMPPGAVRREWSARWRSMVLDHPAIAWSGLPHISDKERLARVLATRDHLRLRRTCRYFSDAPVPVEIIRAAVEAAGTAPSGANHQPWHFAVIGSSARKAEIRAAAEEEERTFYAGKAGSEWLDALAPLGTDADKAYLEIAPWLIVVFAQRRGGIEPGDDKQNYYVSESVGIATGLLLSALHAANVATLTHTPNPMGFLNRACGRPSTEKAAMIVVAGHAAPDASVPLHALRKKPRKPLTR